MKSDPLEYIKPVEVSDKQFDERKLQNIGTVNVNHIPVYIGLKSKAEVYSFTQKDQLGDQNL